jgi:catechol 2,3-dioxygenase-like lactoylglutathione lyase family enzyme
MINPAGIVSGHYECRSLDETVPIFTDVLALEPVGQSGNEMIFKHPNTPWKLIVHEGGPNIADKPLRNHYGVRVATNAEVDRAFEYLESKKKTYRIKIIKPKEYHNAYSVHFYEPGGNFWEIESYENAVIAGIGKTTDPHWTESLSEKDFPGRGYVPQALSHGTIEVNDLDATRSFYEQVLGLEIVQLWPRSIYLKHASTPWYIVNLQVPAENRVYLGKRQRFTIAVGSPDEVRKACSQLEQQSSQWGITGLEVLNDNSEEVSVLFCDLNRNWWEIGTLH